MKPLTFEQIKGFVRMVEQTRDREFNCSECQRRFGEFAERQISGLPLDEALARVEHHLTLCPECREEFLALEKILRESRLGKSSCNLPPLLCLNHRAFH